MRTLEKSRAGAIWLTVWAFASVSLTILSSRCRAGDLPKGGAVSPLVSALETTRAKGLPAIVIITSKADPDSLRLWQNFRTGRWSSDHRDDAQVVSVCRETEPKLVEALKVQRFPTVIVYVVEENQLAIYASTADCRTAEALTAWLDHLDGGGNSGARDVAVRRASFGDEVQPSSQGGSPLPAQTPSAPAQFTPSGIVPAYSAPAATTMASVLQVPSQNFVVQQAPPQFFMAPAQTPVVYVPQASMGSSLASIPASMPAGNMYLPSGTNAPAGLPTTSSPAGMSASSGLAAIPSGNFAFVPNNGMAMAPASGLAVAATAGPSALITNQNVSLAASNVQQEFRVRSGGPFRQTARALGRFFTRVGGQPELVSTQRTSIAPQNQSLGSGHTNISTTSATLAGAPQSMSMFAGQAAAPQSMNVPNYSEPRPSSQDGPQSHGLFRKHIN